MSNGCDFCLKEKNILSLKGIYPWEEEYEEFCYIDQNNLVMETVSGQKRTKINFCPSCGNKLGNTKR